MSIPQSGGGLIERHEQLAEYLASGCKPKSDWRIGTEHEKFGFRQDDLRPLTFDGPQGIEAVLRGAQIAETAPRGPVYIALDAGIQELIKGFRMLRNGRFANV